MGNLIDANEISLKIHNGIDRLTQCSKGPYKLILDLAQSLIQYRIGHFMTPRQFKTFKKINSGHEISLERPGFEPLPKLVYSKLLGKSRRIFQTD